MTSSRKGDRKAFNIGLACVLGLIPSMSKAESLAEKLTQLHAQANNTAVDKLNKEAEETKVSQASIPAPTPAPTPDTVDGLNEAIALQPNNAKLYKRLSELYARNNQPQEALTAINQAVQLDPNNMQYLFARVDLAYAALDLDTVADSYTRILKIDPNNQDAMIALKKIQDQRSTAPVNAASQTPAPAVIENTPTVNTANQTAPAAVAVNEGAPTVKAANQPTPRSTVNENAPRPTQNAFEQNKANQEAFTITQPSVVKSVPIRTTQTLLPGFATAPAEAPGLPEKFVMSGFIEGGVEHDNVTNNFGNWNNQYLRGGLAFDPKNTWVWEIDRDREFFENGVYAIIENNHVINDKWFTNLGAGMSDNSTVVPKTYLGGAINRKLLKDEKLIAYVGFHYYRYRPIYTDQDVNPGLVYNFDYCHFVGEMGMYFNKTNPGNVQTQSGYFALTQGEEKKHYITLRYGFGKEGYLPVGPNLEQVSPVQQYQSYVATLTWRQWIDKNWGFNLQVEHYHNPFYNRMGVTFGLFWDFIHEC